MDFEEIKSSRQSNVDVTVFRTHEAWDEQGIKNDREKLLQTLCPENPERKRLVRPHISEAKYIKKKSWFNWFRKQCNDGLSENDNKLLVFVFENTEKLLGI